VRLVVRDGEEHEARVWTGSKYVFVALFEDAHA